MIGFGATEILLIFITLLIPVLLSGAIIFGLVLSTRKKSGSLKKCPYCAETIQSEAKLCRFCGKNLT